MPTTNIYFCWVRGLNGPTCEILYGLEQNKDSHSKDKKEILQKYELPLEHKDLKLSQLEVIYPYEKA